MTDLTAKLTNAILVWDLPTRLCHWAMAISVVYAWLAVEILEDMDQHFYAGYTVFSLLLFRLIWGFIGTRYARFSSFFFSPQQILDYVRNLPQKKTGAFIGHNPLGSLSALAMMLILMFQVGSGLFSSDDYYHGPLSGLIDSDSVSLVSGWHLFNVDIVIILISLHLIAIAYYQFYKKDQLVKPMITGKKSATTAEQGIDGSRLWLALLVFVICIAVVVGLVNVFADTLPADDYNYY